MPLLELKLLEIQFSALFSYMLWHIELKFCTWLCSNVLQIKFECRQFLLELCPFFGTENTANTQFSALFSYMLWHIELKFCIWLCFTVLQINFECRQFLWELCPFWNSEYWKYTVFRTFLWHALTYWAENLHMPLFYWNKDQLQVSSICVNFLWELCPFWNFNTWNTQFSALFSYMLWHIELKFFMWLSLMYYRSSLSIVTLCPSILSEI